MTQISALFIPNPKTKPAIERFKKLHNIKNRELDTDELCEVMIGMELETYIEQGVGRKRWMASNDKEVCPVCSELNQTETETENSFKGGFRGPPAHKGCRCDLNAVIESIR